MHPIQWAMLGALGLAGALVAGKMLGDRLDRIEAAARGPVTIPAPRPIEELERDSMRRFARLLRDEGLVIVEAA